jgi:hypothetical protein
VHRAKQQVALVTGGANGLGRLDSAAVERDPLSAFLEAEAAYRAGLDQLKALESDRDDALLAASREIPLPELSAATGLSKDRGLRIVDRAARRAAKP